ncbi:MAG: lipopolysaccharide transport periplasmic protein LptA [Rubrivivax sp.]
MPCLVSRPFRLARFVAPALLVALALAPAAARAEKGDRLQPIVVEADKPGTLDLQRQVVVFNGNVKIVQGTMTIRAERIEVREGANGSRSAVATGVPGQPASYRQKRDGVDEWVEGSAQRIDYDGRGGTLRFVGNGSVRRLRDGAVADEVSGHVISWDDRSELFSVEGGEPTADNPGGRVRAVLTPRATPPASAAAPASGPAR